MSYYKLNCNYSGGTPLTGQDHDCFFWRDSAGHEVDIIIDLGSTLVPIEIKSGATISKDFFKGLNYWQNLTGTKVKSRAALIYGGNNPVIRICLVELLRSDRMSGI